LPELRFLRRKDPPTASIGHCCSLRSAFGRVFAQDAAVFIVGIAIGIRSSVDATDDIQL
jgi:hypothetical protein